MVVSTWKSNKIVGSASFVLKERLKLLKSNIKLWKESYWEVGDRAAQEAKAETIQ